MRSVYDSIKSVVSVYPIAASAAASGSYVDTQGYNSAMVVVHVGAATGSPTGQTVDAQVYESDATGSGFTAITDAAITQITSSSDTELIRIDGLNQGSRKRYMKLVITPALTGGSSPKSLISGEFLLGRAFREPVNS